MSEHTPGPWVLKPARSIVGGWAVWAEYEPGKHCQVADIEPWPNDPDTAPESEANARLIAAAPDLLAACEALIDADSYDLKSLLDDALPAIIEQARVAIAKAKGMTLEVTTVKQVKEAQP